MGMPEVEIEPDVFEVVWSIEARGPEKLLTDVVEPLREEFSLCAGASGCRFLFGVDDDAYDEETPYARWYVAVPASQTVLEAACDGAALEPPEAIELLADFLHGRLSGKLDWDVTADADMTTRRFFERYLAAVYANVIRPVESLVLPTRDTAAASMVLDEHVHMWAFDNVHVIGTFALQLWKQETSRTWAMLQVGVRYDEALAWPGVGARAGRLGVKRGTPLLVIPCPAEPFWHAALTVEGVTHDVFGDDASTFAVNVLDLVQRHRPEVVAT